MDKKRRNFIVGTGVVGMASLFGIAIANKNNTNVKQNALTSTKPDSLDRQSSFNTNAELGINLSGVNYYSTERPFLDLVKMASPMNIGEYVQNGIEFDLHGYPTYIPFGQECRPIIFSYDNPKLNADGVVLNKNEYVKNGTYVLLYEGSKADIGIATKENHNKKNVFRAYNNVKLTNHSAGRAVLEINIDSPWYQMNLGISSIDPKNPIKNIRIVPIENEFNYAETLWNPQFLALWSNVKCLRFMDALKTNNSTIMDWKDSSNVSDFTWASDKGVPLIVLIDLCNRLEVNGWFNIPHKATDEYVSTFALHIKEALKPNIKAYVEYTNEAWNDGFMQSRFSREMFNELNLPSAEVGGAVEYYAYRSKQIFNIFEHVFGDQMSARVVRVLASQSAFDGRVKTAMNYQNAYQMADALATAPYMQLAMGPETVSQRSGWSAEDFIDYLEFTALPEAINWMDQNKKRADEFGLPLIAYEGGQHMSLGGGAENNQEMVKLMIEVNKHPRMEKIYTQYLDAWAQKGGGLFCHFNSMQSWTKWGCWSLLENTSQELSRSPKYLAVAKWANTHGQKMALSSDELTRSHSSIK